MASKYQQGNASPKESLQCSVHSFAVVMYANNIENLTNIARAILCIDKISNNERRF